jgi:hypothetical protein
VHPAIPAAMSSAQNDRVVTLSIQYFRVLPPSDCASSCS